MIGGTSSSYGADNTDTIIYGKLSSDGSVVNWTTESAALLYEPVSDFAVASANGYFYLLGGTTELTGGTTIVATANINYGTTARVSIGGALDLVGLSSATL